MENTQMNEQDIMNQLKKLPSKTIEQILSQQNIPIENAVQEAEKSGLLYLAERVSTKSYIVETRTDADGRIISAQGLNEYDPFKQDAIYIDGHLTCGCYLPGNHMHGQEKANILQGILSMGDYFVYVEGSTCGSDLTKNLMKTAGITKDLDDNSISSWLTETSTEVKVQLYRDFLVKRYNVDSKLIDRLHVIPVDQYRRRAE